MVAAAPFCLLVIAALAVGVGNVVSARSEHVTGHTTSSRSKTSAVASGDPTWFSGIIARLHGLSLHGCSPFCSFVKLVWIPLVAVSCAVYFFSGKQVWLTAITAMSFLPLFPHCVCYNVGNSWWIERIRRKPRVLHVGLRGKRYRRWSIATWRAVFTFTCRLLRGHNGRDRVLPCPPLSTVSVVIECSGAPSVIQ